MEEKRHEVKNLLAIILMGVEYLARHLAVQDEQTVTVLQDIREAVKRADLMIRKEAVLHKQNDCTRGGEADGDRINS
jgi:hypothetical protein